MQIESEVHREFFFLLRDDVEREKLEFFLIFLLPSFCCLFLRIGLTN